MADAIANGHLQSTEKDGEQHTKEPTNDVPKIADDKTTEITTTPQITEHSSSKETGDQDEQLNKMNNEAVMDNNENEGQIQGSSDKEKCEASLNNKQNDLNDEDKFTAFKGIDTCHATSSHMGKSLDKNAEDEQSKINAVENATVVIEDQSDQIDENVDKNVNQEQSSTSVETKETRVMKESENVQSEAVTHDNESGEQETADDDCEKRNCEEEKSEVEKKKVHSDSEVQLAIENNLNEVTDVPIAKALDSEVSSVQNEKEQTNKNESGDSVVSKDMPCDQAIEQNEKEQANKEQIEKTFNAPEQKNIQTTLPIDKEQPFDKEAKENAEKINEQSKNKLQEQAESSPHTNVQEPLTASAVEIGKSENIESESSSTAVVEMRKKEEVTSVSTVSVEKGERSSLWYTDEAEKQALSPKPEGYSTTVVGGVVVRKPIPSNSSPEHKKSSPSPHGSRFKKSFGSFFGKRKTSKSEMKPDEAPVTQEDAGKDREDRNTPKENENVEKRESEEKSGEDENEEEKVKVEVVEQSEKVCTPAEHCLEKSDEEHPSSIAKEKDLQGGEIVPIEQGIAKADVEVTESEPTVNGKPDDVEPDEDPVDEDKLLRKRIAKRESFPPSHSPEKRMQMRVSYAGGSKDGEKEVEVIGTREITTLPHNTKSNVPSLHRYSCRELGDVDHEGWLMKRGGGVIFASWKRKWVVLKERHLYYFKTSFDLEAGGVVYLDEKCKVAAAPELKRKFAFKVDSDDPKAHKLFLAADTQEAMDKWLSVLTAASRGEVIIRNTNKQSHDDVRMRKKSGSLTKRAGSVLGIGGLYDYDGSLHKTTSPTHRRASFGSAPKESLHGLTALVSDGEDEQTREPTNQENETKRDDNVEHVETRANVTPSSETEKEGKLSEINVNENKEESNEKEVDVNENVEVIEASETQSAPTVVTELARDEATNMKPEKETHDTSEELVISQEAPVDEASPTREDEPSIAPLEQVVETSESVEKIEEKNKPEADEKNIEKKPTVIEPQVNQLEGSAVKEDQSEKKKENQAEIKESTKEESKSRDTLERNQSKQKLENKQSQTTLKRNETDQKVRPTSQSHDKNSKRMSKSEVKTDNKRDSKSSLKLKSESYSSSWYFVLDVENDKWIEFQFKPKTTDDELLFMVQNIKDARITFTGVPLPGNEQRGRAMTMVSEQNSEILKLNELKRSLKEKERELNAVDELLCQNINRQSIQEWSSRYTYLTEDLESQSSLENSTEKTNDKTTNGEEFGGVGRGEKSEGKNEKNVEENVAEVGLNEDEKMSKNLQPESEIEKVSESRVEEDVNKNDGNREEQDTLQSEGSADNEIKNKSEQDENGTKSKELQILREQYEETLSQEHKAKGQEDIVSKKDVENVDDLDTKL